MSKVPRKLPQPNKDMEQPTSSSEQRKKTKSPYQPRSKGGGKVRWPYPRYSFLHWFPSPRILPFAHLAQTPSSALTSAHDAPFSISILSSSPKPMPFWPLLLFQVLKTTLKVKRPVQRSLSKKVSVKTTNPTRKPKKAGTPVFGHYHSLNERLNQNEPEQAQEKVEVSATSNDDPRSQ